MKKVIKEVLTGERALFFARGLEIYDCVFEDGESPLKESADIRLFNTGFRWKYPLWYSKNIALENCRFTQTARAGVWYTENIKLTDCVIEAPKTFRRSKNIVLENVTLPDAQETLWNCEGVKLKKVKANGTYFGMNCKNVEIENFELDGDYCFDGAENLTIRGSKLLSKDSFWNSKNVTVYDTYISGEYLGWNSENLTFINCTIESLQGLCYVKNLKLINCRLVNTTLAFEYSTVDADICGGVDSIKNPLGGKISAGFIGEIIMEEDKVDVNETMIICTDGVKKAQ